MNHPLSVVLHHFEPRRPRHKVKPNRGHPKKSMMPNGWVNYMWLGTDQPHQSHVGVFGYKSNPALLHLTPSSDRKQLKNPPHWPCWCKNRAKSLCRSNDPTRASVIRPRRRARITGLYARGDLFGEPFRMSQGRAGGSSGLPTVFTFQRPSTRSHTSSRILPTNGSWVRGARRIELVPDQEFGLEDQCTSVAPGNRSLTDSTVSRLL